MDETLKEFDRSVRVDPLFSAEGCDLEAASAALVEVTATTHRLEIALAGQGRLRTPLFRLFFFLFPLFRNALPIPFLRQVLLCEQYRRAYLETPTTGTANDLLQSWCDAARQYSKCLRRYRFLHRVVLWLESSAHQYVLQDLFGNISSIKHIEHTLDTMRQNGKKLHEEVAHRTQLLKEKKSSMIDAAQVYEEAAVTPGTISPWHARLHMLEKSQGITPFRQSDIKASYGPFSYVLPHFEGMPTKHTFMLYHLRNKKTDLESMWVAVVDKYLFTKVWNKATQQSGGKTPFVFSGGLNAADTPYWYEPAGHLYALRDPSYWLDIATSVDLTRRHSDIDAQLVRRQKSSLLHLLLGACAEDISVFVRHTERRKRQGTLQAYSLMYGLLMRTHPALYYLTFNKSVWRISNATELLGESWNEAGVSPYVSETELSKTLSDNDLIAVMSAQTLREERERVMGFFD